MVVGHFAAVADPPVAVGRVPPDTIVLDRALDAFIDAPGGALWRRLHQLVTAVEHGPAGGERSDLDLVGTKFVRREFVIAAVRII